MVTIYMDKYMNFTVTPTDEPTNKPKQPPMKKRQYNRVHGRAQKTARSLEIVRCVCKRTMTRKRLPLHLLTELHATRMNLINDTWDNPSDHPSERNRKMLLKKQIDAIE